MNFNDFYDDNNNIQQMGTSVEDLKEMEKLENINENKKHKNKKQKKNKKNKNSKNKSEKNVIYKMPEIIKEPLIILILFVILSQTIVRKLIGEYLPYINPDGSGKVSFVGIVIYGLILSIGFVIVKKFLSYY